MTKALLIGDPHARREDLDDCRALVRYVAEICAVEHPDWVIWLGDQNHNHSIVNVEVMNFWLQCFEDISQDVHQIVLVGNHDMAANGDGTCHSMLPYRGIAEVVDTPRMIQGVGFLPYMEDAGAFAAACLDLSSRGAKTVVCHQEFNGAAYENGFYSKHGVDADSLPQQLFISGHIHRPQEFGKVWYPGSPRALTISDANQQRSLWVVEFEDGNLLSRKALPLAGVCRAIHHVVVTPETDRELQFPETDKVVIDLKGPTEWLSSKKNELAGRPWQIRCIATDQAVRDVRESDGIEVAFQKFCQAYEPRYSSRPQLEALVKELMYV